MENVPLNLLFLYIDPIKQGLKLSDILMEAYLGSKFLYIDPLKQGLKHYYIYRIKNKGDRFYT